MRNFWKDENGQDLIEYTLLLGAIGVFGGYLATSAIGPEISRIWTAAQALLAAPLG